MVASVAGMGATGDLQPDPMPSPERVRDWPESELDGKCGIRGRIGQAHDPIGYVDRPAAAGDVTEPGMQIDVRQR